MKKFILIIAFACMSIGCATTTTRQVDIQVYFEWRDGAQWICYRTKPVDAMEYTRQFRCNKVDRLAEVSAGTPAEVSSNQKIGM